ncbi:MAG: response regulator transcription factor [Chloroflexi bacterium]|nr:response regulator transcription factor [Chloroflexota bacterium]
MPSAHILLVDDNVLMRRSLAFNLEQAGYRVSSAGTAEDALALARLDLPDLVLLDIGLPGMDGLEALKQYRASYNIPIIFLTARHREMDQVLGLELGADDYVTKPFDLDVLLARIKAVLRRVQPAPPPASSAPLVVGDLAIDLEAHTVMLRGQPLELPRREFDLLHAMASEVGKVLSVEQLLARVWGPEYQGEPQVVYVAIRGLREKLEEDPEHPRRIVSVRGVGYKLQLPQTVPKGQAPPAKKEPPRSEHGSPRRKDDLERED